MNIYEDQLMKNKKKALELLQRLHQGFKMRNSKIHQGAIQAGFQIKQELLDEINSLGITIKAIYEPPTND